MKRVDFVQGSPEWKAWRSSGVGASDCPIIMSGNRSKIERLKAQKWGTETVYETAAMTRGKELEPVARDEASKELLCKLEPVCFQSLKYPGMLCSLDGWFEDTRTLVEIKCPEKAMCARISSGYIPVEYVWQIQHQIAITNASEAYLAVYDGKKLQMIELYRDQSMIDRLISSEMAFLSSRIYYNGSTNDQAQVVEDSALWKVLDRLSEISSMKKEIEDECKKLKDQISELGYTSSVTCGKFTAKWNEGRETIDYKSIPELQTIDKAPYTKKGAGYWTIS